MRVLLWLGAGLAGGLVGAVLWVLSAQYLNLESGWIAWGIGALAGLGVRWAASQTTGEGPGVVAVIAAIFCVFLGKVGAIALTLNASMFAAYDPVLDKTYLISFLADSIVDDRIYEGVSLQWPPGAAPRGDGEGPRDYPADIWAEAEAQWSAMTVPDQQNFALSPVVFVNEEFWISTLADDIADSYESSGVQLKWPGGAQPYEGEREADYPPDVWAEAVDQWNGMSFEERAATVASVGIASLLPLSLIILPSTLSVWDVLWVGLAVFSAYRIGSGRRNLRDA
jgi:hypothetical protein